MNFPLTQKQAALLTPSNLTYSDQSVEGKAGAFGARQSARQGSVSSWLSNVAARIADLPRRQAVKAELAMLSDRELADIGLSRAELGRVFDPSFAARRNASF